MLLVTSAELPQGYTITHDVASGRFVPHKDGLLIHMQGEPLWFAAEFDARLYCWEHAIPALGMALLAAAEQNLRPERP